MNEPRPLLVNIVAFGRLLRRAGLSVGPEHTRTFAQALALVGFERKSVTRAAGRSVFVHRRDERAVFDHAFELFWQRHTRLDGAPLLPRIRQSAARLPTFPAPAAAQAGAVTDPRPGRALPAAASATERLRHADFGTLTNAELRDAALLVDALRPALPSRPSRRWIASGGRGRRPATGRMMRRALATLGEPVRWYGLEHPRRARPIVLILDISGSMERYSRLLLRFAHAMTRTGARVETFVFGTRLTRITRQLRERSTDEALRRVGWTVLDWNGGTRIGESVRTLNQHWVRRTVRSGAIVIIASDGWERGESALLGREMARLRRACHRLYWLSPHAAQPGFAPEVAGLRAALPHVDALLPCHSVASLQTLADVIVGRLHRLDSRPVFRSIEARLNRQLVTRRTP